MADGYENHAPENLQGKYQAMVVCCILGIGSLFSWNSMLTIADYYYQVFPDYHPSRVFTLIYQPIALGTIMILAYRESKISTRKRILTGYILFTISTFLLIVLDLTTKGHGGIGHYIVLCTIVASFGLADATVKGGLVGDLSLMCPELIQSYMAGSGMAGALTSVLRLITKAAFEKSNNSLRKGAMIFLAISTFIELLCVILYAYVFPKLPIVKYYRRKAASEGSKTVVADLAAAGIQNLSDLSDDDSKNQMLRKKELLLQNIDHAVNLFLIYVLTLSIFPGFLYENTGQHGLGDWYALILVATYNFWDLFGRYAPLVKWLKLENRKALTIAVLTRYFLVPAFYFTAKYGDKGWMIMLVSILGLTTGHLTVCIMTIAPNGYENQPPEKLQGKYQAMVVCCILGIGSLVSWNSMLTIADYYYKVFPDYHPSRVLTLVYQPFALGTILILAYHESKINTRKRNLIGYILFTISTFLLIVLDLATKGRGGIGPYIGLCAVVASFGLADATVQGGMIGDLSLMCPELVQSFMGGLAVSGALTSALRLITKAAFEKTNDGPRKGAMMFLAISTCIELLCVFLYAYVFPKLPIVKYYRRKAASEGSKTVSADLAAAGIQNQSDLTDDDSKNQRLSNKELLIQNIDYAVNLFLIYVCTLSIFPGFLYENTGQHGLGDWYALVLVAMYNCWDLVGRYTPLVKWLKIENRKLITIAVLSRYLLIPAFYFTAKYGDQGWMIMLISVLGLTNGHLTVCIMTIAPKGYKGPEQNALGNLLVIFLLGGIFAGVALDWLWLIGKKNAF